ncbi:MAG: DNA-3-methyladenine glycosylase 2 family protein [Lachnospiraceae bacterium]|nr:DNA-3-methyladenine glycosylase 2 family protein [Lachnospiraceae bacterium]
MYFHYGEKETDYLRAKDPALGAVIDKVGHIDRSIDPDLFSSVVHQIIGQQISTKAQTTIWNRMQDAFGEVNPEVIAAADTDLLQSFGMTFRKTEYIREFAGKVSDGSFDLNEIRNLPDKEAAARLTSLRGVGVWTAEMILLFCLERPDILSFNDLAIRRGLRMVYHHRSISRELFEKYRRRYSPYGSVASLYLWAVAGGAVEGLTDPARPKKD